MEAEKNHHHSFIVRAFTAFIEWGNEWLTLSHWLVKGGEYVFAKIEGMMIAITLFCISLPFWVHRVPPEIRFLFYAFFVQRILEFVIVYSRNFILRRGRIYSQFQSDQHRGAWLILMFSMSVLQIVLVFAAWFRLIYVSDPDSFSKPMDGLNSIYYSTVTFLTIGYGDNIALKPYPKILMLFHGALTFFTLVVVVNGLTSTHFGGHRGSDISEEPKQAK